MSAPEEPLLVISAKRMAKTFPERPIRIWNGTGTTLRTFVSELEEWERQIREQAFTEGYEARKSEGIHDPGATNPYRKVEEDDWPCDDFCSPVTCINLCRRLDAMCAQCKARY